MYISVDLNIKNLTSYKSLRIIEKEEFDPFLEVYFSRELQPYTDRIKRVRFTEHTTVTLKSDEFDTPNLPGKEACICFYLLCKISIFNDSRSVNYHYYRYDIIGSGVIYLADLIKYKQQEVILVDRSLEQTYDIQTKTRGKIRVEMSSISVNNPKTFSVYNHFIHKIDTSASSNEMNVIIDEFLNKYRNDYFTPSVDAVKYMHIPRYTINIGTVPAAFYRMRVPREQMDKYFANYLIQISIQMADWSEEKFIAITAEQFSNVHLTQYNLKFNQILRIVGNMLCLCSNAMDYISDRSGTISVERFKNISSTLYAGDCEDEAKQIIVIASQIEHLQGITQDGYPFFYWTQKILKLYVFVMNTGVATTPSLQKNNDNSKEEYICHIYVSAVPRWFFIEKLEISETMKFMAKQKMEQDLRRFAWETTGVPLLLLEGTNWADPFPAPLITYVCTEHEQRVELVNIQTTLERRRLMLERQYPSLRHMGMRIKQAHVGVTNIFSISQEKFSAFYRWVVSAWADLRKYGIYEYIDFSVGQVSRNTHEHLYGVDFRSWVGLESDITFVPVYKLTESNWATAEEILQKERPIKNLRMNKADMATKQLDLSLNSANIMVKGSTSENMTSNPGITALYKLAKSFPNTSTRISGTPYVQPFIEYFANHEKKFTMEIERDLRKALNEKQYIRAIEYKVYPLSEDYELYIIHIKLFY